MPLHPDVVRLAEGPNLATVVTLMPAGQPQALRCAVFPPDLDKCQNGVSMHDAGLDRSAVEGQAQHVARAGHVEVALLVADA